MDEAKRRFKSDRVGAELGGRDIECGIQDTVNTSKLQDRTSLGVPDLARSETSLFIWPSWSKAPD